MNESEAVALAQAAIEGALVPPLSGRRGAALLYQVTVDDHLEIQADPKRPTRGQSAFETDLCIFEDVEGGARIPRVVLEFKVRMSTHDVLTYSAKARRHKQVYPYLRYGLVIAGEPKIPSRFFVHNDALDFCCAAGASSDSTALGKMFRDLTVDEIRCSRVLEQAAFERSQWKLFRTDVVVERSIAYERP